MSFFANVKAYVAGGVLLVIGVMGAVIRHLIRSRKKQKERANRAERSLDAAKQVRQKELDFHDAANRARKRIEENARNEASRKDADRRPDHFGDSRLRVRTKKD